MSRRPKPDPSQRRTRLTPDEREQRQARRAAGRELRARLDQEALEAAELRPADWTLPNGQSYQGLGPGFDEAGNNARVLGWWNPNVYNDSAVAYTFVPDEVPGESDEVRNHRLDRAHTTPAMRRDGRDVKLLRRLYDDPDRAPVATIFCSRCERAMAKLYRIDDSYVVGDGWHFTSPEARMGHLNEALAASEQGEDEWAAMKASAADVKRWPVSMVLDTLPKDHHLSGPRLGYPSDVQLIGCRCGNALFGFGWLRDRAKRGKDVTIDAHDRVFVLPSEMPPGA